LFGFASAGVCFGRAQNIFGMKMEMKKKPVKQRRRKHVMLAA
jgi:hypothetical protein